jgi:hypothetical protein
MANLRKRKSDIVYLDPARTIIERVGGASAAAEATGVNRVVAYRWMRSRDMGGTDGFIPSKYHRDLLEYARRNNLPLTPDDFFCAA